MRTLVRRLLFLLHILLVAASAVSVFSFPASQGADRVAAVQRAIPTLSPEQVIERHINASGIRTAFSKGLKRKGLFHTGSGDLPVENWFLPPHNWSYSLQIPNQLFKRASTGRQGWKRYKAWFDTMSDVQLFAESMTYDPVALLQLSLFYPKLTSGGSVELNGKIRDLILAESPWGPQIRLYFDPATGLLVHFVDSLDAISFDDYREVEGVRIPFRIQGKVEGVTFTEARLEAPSIDEFTPPSEFGADLRLDFSRSISNIPMRDGVRLYSEIYRPIQSEQPLPILLLRSPYGAASMGARLTNYLKELAVDRYVFVFQDIRGRSKSEGKPLPLAPPDPSQPGEINEATDAFDTIEWLVKNLPGNNGKVGMIGASYSAELSVLAALNPHPALRAISQEASPADQFIGDDFHHNGAFRLGYAFEIAASEKQHHFRFDPADTYDWFLRQGPLSNLNNLLFKGESKLWNNFVAHPNYDEHWQREALCPALGAPKVPTLNVAGWWDAEDFYGPLAIYRKFEERDQRGMNTLVIGPWTHGGWNWTEGDRIGAVSFGSTTSRFFREKVRAPWLASYLKGDSDGCTATEALVFQTGSNEWKQYPEWPPRNSMIRKLYLSAEGRLSFDAPASDESTGFDSYVSDPNNPVPYRARPINSNLNGEGWANWMAEDQAFVLSRADVGRWVSAPLEQDLTVTGEIVAGLYASTTGTDSDWVVKLIDVGPVGSDTTSDYHLLIAGEIMRGRFRAGFEKPVALTPGEPLFFKFSLHTRDHCFRKGHRIMVQVQSSWFPLIDRNPQRFVPSIFEAVESDFQPATQRIFRSRRYPSHLELPVVAEGSGQRAVGSRQGAAGRGQRAEGRR
jgi:putative CocE/NonD family hydrolase